MFYPECVIITAVVLYIKHLLYPYDFREKFPYDDPPPKFFGSFSLGELVQYIIQVLTLPIIGFAMIPLQFLGKVADVILIILLVTALIGCSNTSRNTENNAEKINTGINSLITEKEKQDLSNGKSLSVITIDNPSHGVLGDGLGALVSKVRGNDKQTMTAVNLILNNPDTIFVSQNSDTLLKAIKYLGNTTEGKKILHRTRFIFLNSPLTGVSFISRQEIEDLSKLYKFKYSYPE